MQLFTPLNFLGTIYNMVINGLVDLEKLSKILVHSYHNSFSRVLALCRAADAHVL